jgi:hypothetical protein
VRLGRARLAYRHRHGTVYDRSVRPCLDALARWLTRPARRPMRAGSGTIAGNPS